MIQDVWHDPIDAVISWVDGLDPAHLQKRQIFMGSAPHLFHENATNPHRWACNGEIYLCLTSLEHNAPWLRKIWIIVDEQSPDLSRLSAALRAKVHLVDHSDIFANHGAALPTFNSLAIETFMWNIKDISDRFIYFNDDVFLTAPCQKSDFFSPSGPILRGAWADFGALQNDPIQMADPTKFNHYMQLNAADLCGVPAQRLFRAAHVAHPCLRRTMVHLHSRFEAAFRDNARYQMRDIRQFSPQSLHNHACILQKTGTLHPVKDHYHIYSGQGVGAADGTIPALLQTIKDTPDLKMLCVNDLPQLEALYPDIRSWLAQAVTGAL
jgi:hypothetical protein